MLLNRRRSWKRRGVWVKNPRFGSIVLWATLLASQAVAQNPSAVEEVPISVHVTNNLGDIVHAGDKDLHIQVIGNGRSLDLAPDQRMQVPYGQYEVVIRYPGFVDEKIMATVSQREQVIRVALRLGRIIPANPPFTNGCRIEGKITPVSDVTSIRLLQLFGSLLIDVRPRADGTFSFQELECGDYLVIAVGVTGCRSFRAIRVTKEANRDSAILEMELPNAEQSPCRRVQYLGTR